MKKHKIILGLMMATALVSATSCADLGFGVDVDSAGASPYFYGASGIGYDTWGPSIWNYNPAWDWGPGPVLNPGPVYNPAPRPPRPPQQVRPPQQPSMPSFRPPSNVNTNPGINGMPTTVLGTQRPGNLGRPTQGK